MSPVQVPSAVRPPLDEQLRAMGYGHPQSSSSSNGTNAELLAAVEAELTRRSEMIEAMVDMIRSEPTPNGDA